MALTNRIVVEVTRQRLGEPNASKAGRTLNLIPTALKAFARKVAADSRLRPSLLTNQSTVTATITNGVVNLTPLYDNNHILLEYIDVGNIYHSAYLYPCAKITPNQAQLDFYQQEWLHYYVQGNSLFVVPSDQTGSLSFAVPYFPTSVTALPESDEFETMFLDKVYELVMGDDTAADGAK